MDNLTETLTDGSELFQSGDPLDKDASRFLELHSQSGVQDLRPITFDDDDQTRPALNFNSLLEALDKERVLIIAGALRDKRGIARRCGWEFAEWSRDQDPDGSLVRAFELIISSSSSEDFFSTIASKKEPSVFVLTNVNPSIINGNVEALRSAIKNRHWVVIATVRTKHAWKLDNWLEKCWVEPIESELYNAGDLTAYLDDRLGESGRGRLLEANRGEGTVRDYALRLGSPEAIDAFVQEINLLDPSATFDIRDLISRAHSIQQTIATWFHHRLSASEKTLAIALALFEGVEQRFAFAAIEQLMGSAWRKLDTAPQFIDYGDLVNIREFFAFEDGCSGNGRLIALGDDTRSALLRAAWRTHRRQITASLSALVRLVLDPVKGSPFELETLKSDRPVSDLRNSIADRIGELALLSMEDVEPYLLTLVASGRSVAHNVVATALCRIHRGGKRDELFEMLSRWRTNRRSISFVSTRATLKGFTGDQLIGSAIAASVGTVALEDPINKFDKEISQLVKAYSSSNDSLIINRMSQTTIPSLCCVHPMQMVDLLPDLLNQLGDDWELAKRFIFGAGYGLGIALRLMHQGLAPVLIKWIDEGLECAKGGFHANQISLREKKLAVSAVAVALARSSIVVPSDIEENRSVSPKAAVEFLTRILAAENHSFVRSIVMEGLNFILQNEFSETSQSFSELIDTLTREERAQFIERMVNLHCYQRSKQEGGDALLRVRGYDCPIWYDKRPENTLVHETMFEWTTSAKSPAVSSFATEVVSEILTVIERDQEAKQKEMIQAREEEEKRKREVAARKAPESTRHQVNLSFLQRNITVRWATLGCKDIRPTVEGMFASLLPLNAKEQVEILDRYKSEGKDSVNRVVSAVSRALSISKYGWMIILIPLLLLLFWQVFWEVR